MTLNSDRPTETSKRGGTAADVAASVIRRMNVRSTILGWISMILWLLVAGGVVAYTWFFVTYVNPHLVYVVVHRHDLSEEGEQVRNDFFDILPKTAEITVISAYAWAGLVVLAAACTLLYVMASRRVTLHQIHAGLAEISEQLKVLSTSQAVE
jgi:hypothetical protein